MPNEAKNPIIKVLLPERNLGLGRKRKIMMLLAEHFVLNRFFFIDDDIEGFYQYDDDRMEHTNKNLENVTFNALNIMSKVLDHEISKNCENQIVEDDIYRIWLKQLFKLDDIFVNSTHKKDLDYIQDLIQNKNLKDRDSLLDKFSVLKTSNLLCIDQLKVIEDVENEIKEKIYDSKAKIIGQVGLWNKKNSKHQSSDFKSRLEGTEYSTHIVSKARYQVVLYNLDAMKRIHPVSDKVLFEKTLTERDKAKSVQGLPEKFDFNMKKHLELASLGYKYCDNVHILYQIQHGVSGYQIFYYSFQEKNDCTSKVNSEETLDEMEEENVNQKESIKEDYKGNLLFLPDFTMNTLIHDLLYYDYYSTFNDIFNEIQSDL